MKGGNTIIRWRVITIMSLLIAFSLVLVVKLYMVQIMRSDFYKERADRQYVLPSSRVFERGSIFFTGKDGNTLAAASTKLGYKVAINPKAIENPEDIFNNISLFVDVDEEDFIYRSSKSEDPYEEIAKKVSPEKAEKINDLDIDGLMTVKEKWRFYPGQSLAAQTIGFLAYNNDGDLKAQYGLEKQYDDILEKSDQNIFSNFFAEIFSNIESLIFDKKDLKGSVITTLEPEVQTFVEEEINKTAENWHSKTVGAIVMDPKTGEIYSMALTPTFDLNEFNLVEDPSLYSNHLVDSVYEMGSIVKPLTMASGIDAGAVTAETTYNDKGSVTLNNSTFSNYDKRGRGVVNMQEVLKQSLNTGVYFVVSQMGNKNFADYMKKLLGEKTGIDLPNEASPLVSNLDSSRDIEYATASFGQGIAVSPISMIRALAALGNGGLLVKPHIVKEIEYDIGTSKKIEIPEPERIFKPETSEEISRMLVKVVDEALRGGTVALPNHSIAAKTGTAQIARSDGKGYYEDKYLHSFFGYFPAYDPKFIIFLYNVEPQGVLYASETLTEPFMDIAKFLINYYDIPPDR